MITNHYYKSPVLLLTGLIMLAACQKVSNIQGRANPDVQIAFYNASDYLKNQLLPGGISFILVDTQATTSPNPLSIPYFVNNGSAEYLFPDDPYNDNSNQPWIEYMRLYQGAHTVTLTDTGGRYLLNTAKITTVHGIPATLYFSDSMGVFRNWLLPDTVTPQPRAAAIRVMDFSPDAGEVFFTIGSQAASGFPDSLSYGQITSFVPWPDTAFTGINIRFYRVGDSVDILTSAPLNISPGHAYNVVLNGYYNVESFADPVSGQLLTVSPDLNIKLTQNN